MKPDKEDLLLRYLADKGVSSSVEIQQALGISQPTASRLTKALSGRVLALGQGRGVRYGLAKQIGGEAAQHSIWLVDESGRVARVGQVSLLEGLQIHVSAPAVDHLVRGVLPWYLSPLRAQGFLGRLHARAYEGFGLSENPDKWDLEAQLIAALRLHDAPGALLLGDIATASLAKPIPASGDGLIEALDERAADVAKTLPAGSSAGGEQPKFLAVTDAGEHLIVKFTPPRGTTFGDRWSDLLHAESLCSAVLSDRDFDVADTQVVVSKHRTYLVSRRFDRVGATGRRHVVSIGSVHEAFVQGAYNSWSQSAYALADQRRLSEGDARKAARLLQFGRLIGNSDMHSGNLGLYVRGDDLEGIIKGQFSLAPVYDMLPMRWRPDAAIGAPEYAAFSPQDQLADDNDRDTAADFWSRLSVHESVSKELRQVAAEMVERVVPTPRPLDRPRG